MESPFAGVHNEDVDGLCQFVYKTLLLKLVWSIITFFCTIKLFSCWFKNNILIGQKENSKKFQPNTKLPLKIISKLFFQLTLAENGKI